MLFTHQSLLLQIETFNIKFKILCHFLVTAKSLVNTHFKSANDFTMYAMQIWIYLYLAQTMPPHCSTDKFYIQVSV